MVSSSVYDVMNMNTIDKSKVEFNGTKSSMTVLAGTTNSVDVSFADVVLITGAIVKVVNQDLNAMDVIKFQVVHPVYGVLKQFIDWYASTMQEDLSYPAKIPAGIIIRVVYQNTSAQDVIVKINYRIHKIIAAE